MLFCSCAFLGFIIFFYRADNSNSIIIRARRSKKNQLKTLFVSAFFTAFSSFGITRGDTLKSIALSFHSNIASNASVQTVSCHQPISQARLLLMTYLCSTLRSTNRTIYQHGIKRVVIRRGKCYFLLEN